MGLSYLKKITTSYCGLTTEMCEEIAEKHGKQSDVAVLNIGGTVTGMETGLSQFGPYTRFFGQFEAQNHVNGESYRSRLMILPVVAESAVTELVMSTQDQKAIEGQKEKEKEKGAKTISVNPVTLAIAVTVRYYNNPNKTGTKFAFGVSPLTKSKEPDMLSKFMADLPKPKALVDQTPAKSAKK